MSPVPPVPVGGRYAPWSERASGWCESRGVTIFAGIRTARHHGPVRPAGILAKDRSVASLLILRSGWKSFASFPVLTLREEETGCDCQGGTDGAAALDPRGVGSARRPINDVHVGGTRVAVLSGNRLAAGMAAAFRRHLLGGVRRDCPGARAMPGNGPVHVSRGRGALPYAFEPEAAQEDRESRSRRGALRWGSCRHPHPQPFTSHAIARDCRRRAIAAEPARAVPHALCDVGTCAEAPREIREVRWEPRWG